MHPLIYDVAVSIDGYIAGPDGDISGFAQQGPVVDDYRARLAAYATAIMGRHTYEFGYRFGLTPGQNPYPHMETFVCSDSLTLPPESSVRRLAGRAPDTVAEIKHRSSGPVYLVGGGIFAAALLEDRLIDRIVLKRAPILLGGGTPLFARMPPGVRLTCAETRDYGGGYLLQHFEVTYADVP